MNPTFAKASLMALTLAIAAPLASAATTLVTFTNATRAGATVSSGTVTVASTVDGTNNPATITYSVTGLNLDDVGTNDDSLTVTLSLTGVGGAPGTPGGGRVGVGTNIDAGESISYTFQSVVATTGTSQALATNQDFNSVTTFNFDSTEQFTLVSNGGTSGTFSGTGTGTGNGTLTTVSMPGATDTQFSLSPSAGASGQIDSTAFTVQIPEPSSAMLFGSVALLGLVRRRR